MELSLQEQQNDHQEVIVKVETFDTRHEKCEELPILNYEPSIQSNLIKNYEIKIRGKWNFPVLPFPTKEYFICYEEDTTVIGARLKTGKTRREMLRILIDFQESLSNETPENKALKVDSQPVFTTKPRWGSIVKCHPTLKSLTAERIKARKKKKAPEDIRSKCFHTIVKSYSTERDEQNFL